MYKEFVIVFSLVFAVAGSLLFFLNRSDNAFEKRCAAKRGEPVYVGRGRLCVKPGTVIE